MSDHAYLQLGGFNPADYNLPVDPRMTLHKEEMQSVGTLGNKYTGKLNDGTIISLPEIYFCACYETDSIYIFDINNEYEAEFGRFRQVKSSVDLIPNPEEPSTAELKKLKIDDTVFKISDPFLETGTVPPTPEKYGEVGQLYIDKSNPGLYQCAHNDNSEILKDPGTPLPISLGNNWESVKVTGVKEILSNGGLPLKDTKGVNGQLFVDELNCDLYICEGQDAELNYKWALIHKTSGYDLVLSENSFVPKTVLKANGTWVTVTNAEQKIFSNVVAFTIDNDKTVKEVLSGLISDKLFAGYTLISSAKINIQKIEEI